MKHTSVMKKRSGPGVDIDRTRTPVIVLTRAGTVLSGSVEDLKCLSEQFDRDHCIRLPQLMDAGLLTLIQRQLDQAEFDRRINEGIGVELCMRQNIAFCVLHFLTNTPALFQIIQQITRCGRIGCFTGRVYRMVPGCGHEGSWHRDTVEHRMIGLSINLSAGIYSGGIFQLRDNTSGQIVCQVANTGFGDGILFRIADHLAHRITTVEGTVPRTAFVGWFRSRPKFRTLLTETA